jgi:hypothetical protein
VALAAAPGRRQPDFPEEFYERHRALVMQEGTLQKKRIATEHTIKNSELPAEEKAALAAEIERLQQEIWAVRAHQEALIAEAVRNNARPPAGENTASQRRRAELLRKREELREQWRKLGAERRQSADDTEPQERIAMEERLIAGGLERLREDHRRLHQDEAAQAGRGERE